MADFYDFYDFYSVTCNWLENAANARFSSRLLLQLCHSFEVGYVRCALRTVCSRQWVLLHG